MGRKDIFHENYKINNLVNQEDYLVSGNLVNWKGDFSNVYSTISSTKEYKPTLLGKIPSLGKEQAIEALDSACDAFDNGRGEWPTMKVRDRIKHMRNFANEMKTKRDEILNELSEKDLLEAQSLSIKLFKQINN